MPADADGKRLYRLPSRVGQYTVIRELGHGGMGVVYLAEQANLKRLVALKVVRHGVNATAEEVTRFCVEAEAVARLQHPNIVQIHEVGGEEGVYYLALEYVSGGSLDRQLAGAPQDPRAAARLTEKLARAIHHAHQRGILHRDLKPANILMSGEWPEVQWRRADRATFLSPPAAGHLLVCQRSPISVWPNAWSRATHARKAAWFWALPVTSPRNKRRVSQLTSLTPSTSTAWGRSCTRC